MLFRSEINRGIVAGALKNAAIAEQHFQRAIELAPTETDPKYYYGRWLNENAHYAEAADVLRAAIAQNPSYLDAYHLLMQDYSDDGDSDAVRSVAQMTLARFPSDSAAQTWLTGATAIRPTPESWLNKSLVFYKAGKFNECIEAAKKALELRPDYSDAWNNIGAAYNARKMWDQGIEAGEKAVQQNPNSELAKNNLAWAKLNKAKTTKMEVRR